MEKRQGSERRVERACIVLRTRWVVPLLPFRGIILMMLLQDVSEDVRLAISRVAMLITLLAKHCIPISADIITEAYEVTLRIVGDEAEGVKSLARAEVGEEILRSLALGRE
jgi:hypothetical protein